jgi:hypothetical protein
MIGKNHLAEIKLSDFDALLAGLKEVAQQNGTNTYLSKCIPQMESAKTPIAQEEVLSAIANELEFSFPVAIILQLGCDTYEGFVDWLDRLEEAGWMAVLLVEITPFIRIYLRDCEIHGRKSQAVEWMKETCSTVNSLRKALSLAGIQDNYMSLLESAREVLSHP